MDTFLGKVSTFLDELDGELVGKGLQEQARRPRTAVAPPPSAHCAE